MLSIPAGLEILYSNTHRNYVEMNGIGVMPISSIPVGLEKLYSNTRGNCETTPPPPNRAMCGFVFGRILMLRLPTRSWRWLHAPKCGTFNTLSRLSCVFDSVLHVTRSSHLFSFPPHIFANGTVMPSSVLGMNLFGGKFCTHPTERRACTCAEQIADIGCKCARKNFDTLLWSLVTVFQVNSRAFRRGSRCGVAGGGSYVGTTGSCAKSSHLDACIRHKFWCCCCAIKGLVETRRLATTWHCDLFR